MKLYFDGQIHIPNIYEQRKYLLETELWTDCNFIVGQKPNQQTLKGHKLFLAMASPVFGTMFFGSLTENCDEIHIPDVNPKTFKTLLTFIYTNDIHFDCFELTYELCYCAKKYMLPSLVTICINHLKNVTVKEVCKTYEFAKFFDEFMLMMICLQIICEKTLNFGATCLERYTIRNTINNIRPTMFRGKV